MATRHHERVLIVEDDCALSQILADEVGEAGLAACEVSSAEEAYERLLIRA